MRSLTPSLRHGLALSLLLTAPFANASPELAQQSGCLVCHQVDSKIIGPAYRDIAAKYRGQADAKAKLVAKVKQGGVGVWGDMPMPPNAHVSDADIDTLVTWVLGL
ncbi:c-type cytochrome [Marichromatium gracile]|uniref:c-type cytochrome n=1 Tax=Marichromatium gracile TaxID=1048 RepID=UPI001AFD4CF0|nr:c-type cytochrome [Marichromatium gracile]MBO8087481.1 c-type cytochrome [Marichromatium sp.]MCF1184570.1 c-type cytochrome [Marichromatium gracile]